MTSGPKGRFPTALLRTLSANNGRTCRGKALGRLTTGEPMISKTLNRTILAMIMAVFMLSGSPARAELSFDWNWTADDIIRAHGQPVQRSKTPDKHQEDLAYAKTVGNLSFLMVFQVIDGRLGRAGLLGQLDGSQHLKSFEPDIKTIESKMQAQMKVKAQVCSVNYDSSAIHVVFWENKDGAAMLTYKAVNPGSGSDKNLVLREMAVFIYNAKLSGNAQDIKKAKSLVDGCPN